MRICRAAVKLLVLTLVCLTARQPDRAEVTTGSVLIPGGREAVARVVRLGRFDNDRFLHQLNAALLLNVRPDGDWKQVSRRLDLVEYLDTVREIRTTLPHPLELSGSSEGIDKNLRNLAELVGYRPRFSGGQYVMDAKEGDKWERRRKAARALGWDPPAILQQLQESGNTGRLELWIPDQMSEPPVSLDAWSEIAAKPITADNALAELATDQRLGLLAEGLQRCSPELAAQLDSSFRRWIYREASIPFYRYASAFQTRGGRLRLPGGEETADAWRLLVGADPDDTLPLLKNLLSRDQGRGAFLWHSLYFCEPAVGRYYLLRDGNDRNSSEKSLRRFYNRLGATQDNDRFDEAHGARLGFGALARALPLSEDGASLELPGGLGVWFKAIQGNQAPDSAGRLDRMASKGEQRELDEERFIEKALTEGVKVGSTRLLALPRLIQVVRMWNTDAERLTPENVILLSRATELYPALLDTVEDLPFSGPEALRDTLLTVRHLDDLSDSAETFVLLANFQGGIELLRLLSVAGNLPSVELEGALNEWIAIHRNATDPHRTAPAQLDWLTELLAKMPRSPGEGAGRGPVEAAYLQALVPMRDPQSFAYRGLEYTGRRGEDLAREWVEIFSIQGVPAADQIYELAARVGELNEALLAADAETVADIVGELEAMITALPTPRFDSPLPVKEDRLRFEPLDRAEALRILAKIQKQQKAAKLPKLAVQTTRLRELTPRELRPFLLAPAYLEASTVAGETLIADPDLIRKHALVRDFDPVMRPNPLLDSPWIAARVVPSSSSAIGTRVAGYLGSVDLALHKRALAGRAALGSSGSIDPKLVGLLLRTLSTKSWSGVDEPLVAYLHLAGLAGEEISRGALDQLESGGAHLELVEQRVPLARLHRAAKLDDPLELISVSERVQLGLAALEGDGWTAPRPELIGASTRGRFEAARQAVGADSRDRLKGIGPPLLHVNGSRRSGVQGLPAYEALQDEGSSDALWERLSVDLQLTILVYLGEHELPETVGRDLLGMVLQHDLDNLRQATPRDWVGVLVWLRSLTGQMLDERMRQCLTEGTYELQLS